jgi:hypothetical protein
VRATWGVLGVAVRVEISDGNPEEVGRSNQRSTEREELVPVKPKGLRIADGGQDAFVEDVEVEVQPGRTPREPPGGVVADPIGTALAYVRSSEGIDCRVEAGVLASDVGVKFGGAMSEQNNGGGLYHGFVSREQSGARDQ